MKNNLKKAISVLLCATAVMSVASCGKDKTEEIPTLTWYVVGDKQEDTASVMAEVNKITEEKIGAKLDIQFIDAAAFQQRMSMLMASGDPFDLCFTGYTNVYNQAAENGGLLELDELLETVPDLKKSIPDDMWEASRYDGKIYAVPNNQIQGIVYAYELRKELLDKYNIDASKMEYPEDIEPYLQAVKDNEPNLIPYRGNYGAWPWTGKKWEALENGLLYMNKETGEILPPCDVPEVKQSAKTRNKWFNQGFYRPDALTVGNDSADYNAGRYATSDTSWKPGAEANVKNQRGWDIEFVKLNERYKNVGYCCSTMIGIGRNSQYPEKAMKFIELVNLDKELYNLICFGIQGKHYNLDENGQVEYIDGSGYAPKADWKFGNQLNAYTLKGQPLDVWEETQRENDSAIVSRLNGFALDKSEFQRIANEYNTANSTNKSTLNVPVDKFEEQWEANRQAELKNGAYKLVDNINAQIAEWEKTK